MKSLSPIILWIVVAAVVLALWKVKENQIAGLKLRVSNLEARLEEASQDKIRLSQEMDMAKQKNVDETTALLSKITVVQAKLEEAQKELLKSNKHNPSLIEQISEEKPSPPEPPATPLTNQPPTPGQ